MEPPSRPDTAGSAHATSMAAATSEASLYLHPQTLARLSSFELRAKMIVEGLSSGQHRSPYQGFSVEFAQHRPYTAGDDLRHLDWKVFARSDKLHLKQYQQETNFDLIVMVDCSGSMSYGSRSFADASGVGREKSPDGRAHWSKFDHATALAAALSYITLRQGDRVGLEMFDEKVRLVLKRSSSQGTWRQIVGALSSHPAHRTPAPTEGSTNRSSDLRRAIDETFAQISNRCILAIVSDFFMDIESIKEALARTRHAQADVMAFQIMDRAELEFDLRENAGGVLLEGLEGESTLRIDPRAIRRGYLEALEEHNSKLRALLRGMGYDYTLVNTHDFLGPALAAFVSRRNAQIKKHLA
ncbi:MAG: DUF58 domain-containing protein [Phycisphaerae bacterium]|nr:DUF58 domain-containing protein [Phycisphaerae bacterium]MBN8599101.1 DUF58 domain-containing protein [Planctomycetota bacterium]